MRSLLLLIILLSVVTHILFASGALKFSDVKVQLDEDYGYERGWVQWDPNKLVNYFKVKYYDLLYSLKQLPNLFKKDGK